MNYIEFSEFSKRDSKILSPTINNQPRGIGKEYLLPNISPKEHRLFVQKPSLIKNFAKPKEDLRVYKDIIERYLKQSKVNNVSSSIVDSNPIIKHRIKSKNKENILKITMFRRFISTKPLKSKRYKTKTPDLKESSLFINQSKIPVQNNINRDKLVLTTKRSSDSDEYKINSFMDLSYLKLP